MQGPFKPNIDILILQHFRSIQCNVDYSGGPRRRLFRGGPAAADRDRREQRGDESRQQGGVLVPGHLDLRAVVPDARPQHHHRLRPQVEEGVVQAGRAHQRSVQVWC